MKEKEKDYIEILKDVRDRLPCQSFREAVRRATDQIEIGSFSENDRAFAKEICFTIAEVYMSRDDWVISIGGDQLEGRMVREVFRELTAEHVKTVIRNFRNTDREIINKRAYIRTALYNSVFELEAGIENTVSRIMRGEL